VANKYLTGFDQPKLCTMYVDKKLQGVFAVQALSRLNRCNAKLNKRTEDMFVLDFFNDTADIKKAFDPFYTATSLSNATDVNMLHDVKETLDDVGVYDRHEVESFNELYFNNEDAEKLSPVIDMCAERFESELDLEDGEKIDFKIKAKQFVKVYAQLACIMPFENIEWEKLHWFLKFLIPKLKIKNPLDDAIDELLNSIDLSTYGLERSKLNNAIGLDSSETEVDPQNPEVRGAHGTDSEESPLDEIIRTFNERHFAGWEATPDEQKVKLLNIARHVVDNPNYKTQVANNPDAQNSRIATEKLIKEALSQERRKEISMYKLYTEDPEFKRAFDESIIRMLSKDQIANVLQEELDI
jgi:type I restriction enzyme R subunit